MKTGIDKPKVHFAPGRSVKTFCGIRKISRQVIVSLFSDFDGVIITNDLQKVTCKRCLRSNKHRLHRIIAIEAACPGIFDKDCLYGEEWLLEHALDVSAVDVDNQILEITHMYGKLSLTNDIPKKDIREVLKNNRS